jgi:hypothetical protein
MLCHVAVQGLQGPLFLLARHCFKGVGMSGGRAWSGARAAMGKREEEEEEEVEEEEEGEEETCGVVRTRRQVVRSMLVTELPFVLPVHARASTLCAEAQAALYLSSSPWKVRQCGRG